MTTPADGRFVVAVEAIYGAAAAPAEWPQALKAIADCFGDSAAILNYRHLDGSTGCIISPGQEAAADAYNSHWWQHDFRLARSLERGYLINGDTITDRHVVTDEEARDHPFYVYLRQYDLGWFAGTTVSPAQDAWVGLSTQRSVQKPPFSDDELLLHTRLGRHVENALRLGIRLIDAEIASVAFADALARVGVGVFLLDGAGKVVIANAAGERLIGDGLALADGRLRASFAPEREALEQAIRAAADDRAAALPNPKPVILRGPHDDRFLAAYVLPARLPTGHMAEYLLSGVRTLLVVTASKADAPVDPTIVRDLLGLTLGEARIAALIGSGLAPRETAGALGITEETTRTTLKRVFDKTGVSRQSELTALLTRLVVR